MAIAKWARKMAHIPLREFSFEFCPQPKHKPKVRQPFTPTDVSVYVAELADFSRPLFLFLALSGVRVSEACGLTDDSIVDSMAVFTQKGGRERKMPLSGHLKTLIEQARQVRAKTPAKTKNIFVCQAVICPCCGHKFLFFNEKDRKP